MELDSNLIGVQSVLIKCSRQIGDLTKINYKGGNEGRIIQITSELATFLNEKHLLEEKKVPQTHKQQLNKIVFFLALNTEFKRPLPNMEQYFHLSNIAPPLSKCILVNICVALDLVESYGYVIETLPLEAAEELLDQIIDCLRTAAELEDHLRNAFLILKSVAKKLSQVELSYKTEDIVEDIVRITTIILQNLTSLTTDQAESLKAMKIYHHMGLTLLHLFDLLLFVDESHQALTKFIASVVSTACSIIRCVTLNVFCSWAEIDYEDQPLQTAIASKAYLVMEKFQKNKLASELVGMLSSIARKPKTIAERILEADTPTIIKMVDEKNEHQRLWFRALFNTPVFSDRKVVTCVKRWWQLSEETTVDRLLSLPLPKEPEERQLIIKCASSLSLDALTKVLIAYFHREKFKWHEHIADQLVTVFNHLQSDISDEVLKQLLLLVLQNAKCFFEHLFATAFKRSAELITVLQLLKDISKIDNIGLDTLNQLFKENEATNQNIANHIQLLDSLLASHVYNWDFIVSNLILPQINKHRGGGGNDNLEHLKCYLHILKHFQNLKCDLLKEVDLFEYIMSCASENRCKSFLEFESTREDVTSVCVDYILHKCGDFSKIEGRKESFPNVGANLDDPWSNYYKSRFLSDDDVSFVDWVLPNFNLANYKEGQVEENFTRLLKTLPRCTPAEWRLLLKEIASKCQWPIVLNALSDIAILLCDFVESQLKNQAENADRLLGALKFYLQNYAASVVAAPTSLDEQLLTVHAVCRVLKHIPEPLKLTDGFALINTLPEEALRALADDREFVALIISINDKQLCKALAQKVLASKKS